jgi:23S rRNA pseudouridine1911/1915/1917 synthase
MSYRMDVPALAAEEAPAPLVPGTELMGEEASYEDADELPIHEHRRFHVDPGQEPQRIDVFLASRLKNISRSRIQLAAEVGFLQVNGGPVKPSYKVRPLDEVQLFLPYPPAPDLAPEAMPLSIAYEDDYLLVVDKPAGLVVHPGVGNYSGTLVNGLLHYFQQLPIPPGGGEYAAIRPGLVHRIDKDTSGLLLVAKTEAAFTYLARQFFVHTTSRVYWALVWGDVKADRGTITGAIARSVSDRKKYVVAIKEEDGKPATTHYRVLARFETCTLVECKLETGRTHQIRVHMKHIGHTLFSDSFYGGDRLLSPRSGRSHQRFLHDLLARMPRQALHARTLGFDHPATETRLNLASPLPLDFADTLRRLAAEAGVPLPAEVLADGGLADLSDHAYPQLPI